MNRTMICTAALLAGMFPGTADAQYAERLPATTGLYLELSVDGGEGSRLAGTRLLELWNEEELQDFLEPALSGIRDDLDYLMREAPESVRERVMQGLPGNLVLAVPSLTWSEGEDEPDAVEVFAAVRFGDDAQAIFDAVVELLEEDEEASAEVERTDVAGRPAVVTDDEEEKFAARLVVDGDWLALQVAYGDQRGFGDVFGEPAASPLTGDDDYRTVRRSVGGDETVAFAFIDFDMWMDVFVRTMRMDDDEDAASAVEVLTGAPAMKAIRAIGFGVDVDGELLQDRFFVHAPGDRSSWDPSGPVGDAPRRHAALADPDADVLFTSWIDLGVSLELQRKELERVRAIVEESDPDSEVGSDPIGEFLSSVSEAIGFDLEQELVPILGNHLSVYASTPSGALAVPDAGLIVDLKDGDKLDELLAGVVARDEEIAEVSFQEQTAGDDELLSVQLVNAGVPVVPTLCRRGDQLFITTTPQAMKGLLASLGRGESLASASTSLEQFLGQTPESTRCVVWTDMGEVFEYLYGFVGLGLSAMRMSGAEVSDRFDGSLLPTGDMLAEYLGVGTFVIHENDDGVIYEGRSTLGNPLTGTLGGLVGVVAMIGFSEGTREAAADARTDASKENLLELARTMDAYKGSIGGGAYPESLVRLLDRGLLKEKERLLDPSDPSPRRSRTGTGDRVPVSYGIGSIDVLPESMRNSLEEGARTILYSRGAWHERFGRKSRLVVVLGEAAVRYVSEEDWGGR